MATNVNIAPSIRKLDGNNYNTWVKDMKFILIDQNSWKIVEGTEKPPEIKTNEIGTGSAADLKYNDYQRRAGSALSLIYMNISEDYKSLIENADDPVQAWKLLSDHFQPESKSRHMSLFSKLFSCFILPNESVTVFSTRLRHIADQLNGIGQPIKEIYVTFQLLRYLPDKFESIVQTMLRWDDATFTYHNVSKELAAEESRLQLREFDKGRIGHEIEVQNVTASTSSKAKYKDVTCYRCGKAGHFARYCKSKLHNQYRSKTSFPPRRFASPSSSSFFSDSSNSSSDKKKRVRKPRNRKTKSRNTHSNDSPPKNAFFVAQASLNEFDADGCWIFDTAASHHFCKDKSLFENYTDVVDEKMHVAVEGMAFPIVGKGDVTLRFKGDRKYKFTEVLHAPNLRKNLISGPRMDIKGASYKGRNGCIRIYDNEGDPAFKAKLVNGVYYVFPKPVKTPNQKTVTFEASAVSKDNLDLWHARFAHINPSSIVKTSKNRAVSGLPRLKHRDFHCHSCQISKQRRVSFPALGYIQSKRPLERVYSDIWGPSKVPGRNGERYFMTIIDDYSRKSFVYPLQDKTQVFGVFQRHIARAERFLGTKLKYLRTDNGKEYDNDQFKSYCAQTGVKHEFMNVYTPEQNGPSERFNQTVLNGVRSILHHSKMPQFFWPDAAIYFAYTYNRVCHKGYHVTPFELYSGHKPSVRHLKPFGTPVYVGVPKATRRSKFDARAKSGLMIGYGMRTKGYRIWLEDERKVIETINVRFKEGISSGGHDNAPTPDLFSESTTGDGERTEYAVEFRHTETPAPDIPLPDSDDESESEEGKTSESEEASQSLPNPRRVQWLRKPVLRRDKSRTDVFYYENGKNERLRSIKNVKDYCKKHNIFFDESLFDFSGSNTYNGIIDSDSTPSTSAASCNI